MHEPSPNSQTTTPSPMPARRQPRQIWLQHPAHVLAFGFGSGLSRRGPGTVGTLWAWLSFVVMSAVWPVWVLWLITFAGLVAGIWICQVTGRALGVSDHSAIVWDEIVAFWLVLLMLPSPADPYFSAIHMGWPAWQWQALAFALFRFFDIAKPPPIDWVDARVKGGLGVMADDLLAAVMTLMTMAVLARWLG
ncbi:MAG: phosphatidylglycerophosphatase A [Burkholderiaceae bacterium]